MKIQAKNVSKSFGAKRVVFAEISFTVESGSITGIVGKNGSGKSTLAKIIAQVIEPSSGVIEFVRDGVVLSKSNSTELIGFAAPYLQLYEEFTIWEHITIDASLRGLKTNEQEAEELLNHFELWARRNEQIKNFSSGLKQRVKLIIAALHQLPILILDEPTTNLDEVGIKQVHTLIQNKKNQEAIILLATNEKSDIALCDSIIDVTL